MKGNGNVSLITNQKKQQAKKHILFCVCGSFLNRLAIFDPVEQNTNMVIKCIFHAVSNYALKACAACYFHNSIKKYIYILGSF